MKKYILILLAAVLSLSVNAQKAKFGHVDYAGIMKIIPGIDTAQEVMKTYQAELQTTGEQMAAEFKQKEAEYAKLASGGTSPSILKLKEDDLNSMYERIQTFANNSQQELQKKQVELLQPFQDKLLAAIKKVAAAGSYMYVFDISTLAFYADSDDLTSAVKAELGIK